MTSVLLAMLLAAGPHCGVERWPVKTLTDREAASVNFDVITQVTVEDLIAEPAPKYNDANLRSTLEKQVYYVEAEVVAYKLEADRDFHVVIRGVSGATMIAEFTDPKCAAGSPVQANMAQARKQFVFLFGRPKAKLKHLRRPVAVGILGVGFFDKIHGQTGVAPNGVELHPMLKIEKLPGRGP